MQIDTTGTNGAPEILRFRTFLKDRHIPISSGYVLAARGEIRVVRLAGRSYVDMNHWREKVKNLPPANIRVAA